MRNRLKKLLLPYLVVSRWRNQTMQSMIRRRAVALVMLHVGMVDLELQFFLQGKVQARDNLRVLRLTNLENPMLHPQYSKHRNILIHLSHTLSYQRMRTRVENSDGFLDLTNSVEFEIEWLHEEGVGFKKHNQITCMCTHKRSWGQILRTLGDWNFSIIFRLSPWRSKLWINLHLAPCCTRISKILTMKGLIRCIFHKLNAIELDSECTEKEWTSRKATAWCTPHKGSQPNLSGTRWLDDSTTDLLHEHPNHGEI